MKQLLQLSLLLQSLLLISTANASVNETDVEKFISFSSAQRGLVPVLWYFDKESGRSLGEKKFDLSCLSHDLFFNPNGTVTFGLDQKISSDCRYNDQNKALNFTWTVVRDAERGVTELLIRQDDAECNFKISPRWMAKSILVITTTCRQKNFKNLQFRFTKIRLVE